MTGPVPPGPFVAKADATTGKQVWRTYLDNANVSKDWIATTNLNILSNGKVVTAGVDWVALLDPDTGRVLRQTTLPTGTVPPEDISFKKVTVAPDGTLILISQARPKGSTLQGSFAWVKGFLEGQPMQASVIVAVDPDTLNVLDWTQMPSASIPAHIVTTFEDKIAIYATAIVNTYRYFWDPKTKKLSEDKSWVAPYVGKGQTPGAAPGVLGEWIVIQANGVPASTPSTIVAISQKDPKKIRTIAPFGELKPGQISYCNPKASVDVENNMIYSADLGVGKVAGIKLDPATGEMKTMFVVDDWTFTFQPLIGPQDKRVLLLTNMRFDRIDTQKPVAKEDLMKALFLGEYKEQLTWRDAATGRILAESDFFERLSPGSLTTPGFGGRVYFPTDKGFIVLQAMPKPAAPGK
jgi:outer membrane protein assembly factor BamB